MLGQGETHTGARCSITSTAAAATRSSSETTASCLWALGPAVYLAPYRRWAIHERRCSQWRIRIRYRDLRTQWFDHLTVAGAELGRLLDGTGWRIDRLEPGPAGRNSTLLLKDAS
jgi:hypothetical protein